MMSFARFRELATPGRLVPVWRDMVLDVDTPLSAFAKLRRGPFAFLLESAPGGAEMWARYSFLGTEPRAAWRLRGQTVQEWTAASGWGAARTVPDPLADLRRFAAGSTPVEAPELGPFWTGIVGYFGYDVVRLIERLGDGPLDDPGTPDALFMATGPMVIVDNLRGTARVVAAAEIPERSSEQALRGHWQQALDTVDDVIGRLRLPSPLQSLEFAPAPTPAEGVSSVARDRFVEIVRRAREYILAGDIFQVVLSRRIDTPHDFDTTSLYRALRVLNPSPYMYHLVLDDLELVGSSPELQVRLDGERVTVRPIAGTRPRGLNPSQDEVLERELMSDEKERAEHVMLVDLARNDVSRTARAGTVRVGDLMRIERYSHVLHMVSEVTGQVRPALDAFDVFRATFPAGTVSGAPKVRAMEIIDELEPQRRGPYAGAVGYIAGGARRMDLAITIRTCVVANGTASVQAGAGIVADSDPEREWEETSNKARALLTAIAQARAAKSGNHIVAGA